ncbi:MAG: Gfo/Idh/MocA family oxidoreductase, partial [Deltaproteobacteria bacterium]|nr:Gfo/Idh/MocA family oxidoreductase [Deltaproteobacteria bacterium]
RAYVDIETLLAAERPQALAICSPHATHAQYLERALDSHVHVLCEKPLVWGDDFAARTARTVQRFAERGLVLIENCQWPTASGPTPCRHLRRCTPVPSTPRRISSACCSSRWPAAAACWPTRCLTP